jgi:hypothetical protein
MNIQHSGPMAGAVKTPTATFAPCEISPIAYLPPRGIKLRGGCNLISAIDSYGMPGIAVSLEMVVPGLFSDRIARWYAIRRRGTERTPNGPTLQVQTICGISTRKVLR